MNFIKSVRIFLLVLIVIGIGLLVTQKLWVPKVVNAILKAESIKTQNAVLQTSPQSDFKVFTDSRDGYSFEYPNNYVVRDSYSNTPYGSTQYILENGKDSIDNPDYADPNYTMPNPKNISIELIHDYNYLTHDPNDLSRSSEEEFLKKNNQFAMVFCQADGEDSSEGSTKVVKQTKHVNKNNVTYYETYLNYIHSSSSETKDLGIIGPIYLMNFSSQSSTLFIRTDTYCTPKPTIQPPQSIVPYILENFKVLGV